MFIDGTIEETFTRSWSEKFTLRLPPKEHTVLFKKNGIEVYSKTVTVKKSTEGITFLDIDLIVTGSIILKSNRPVSPGVVAHVFVDNVSVKRWPVGADSVELLVDVGSRVVEVRTTEPMQAVVFKSTVLIDQPGTQKVLMVKN